MTTTDLKPGDQFHILAAITIPYSNNHSAVVQRGQTVTVTAEMIDLTTDRTGHTWLSLVDDEPGQIARWGHRLIAPGPAPESVVWWNSPSDTASVGVARSIELEEARAHADPAERRERVAAVNAKYGLGNPSNQHVLRTWNVS